MIERRSLLTGIACAGMAVAGCAGTIGRGGSDPRPVEQFVPSAAGLGEEYGSVLGEHDYTVWSVDVATIRSELGSMSDEARAVFETPIPVRHDVQHEDAGIDYEAVERILLIGVPTINTFPAGVDHVGHLVATVTIGDFDREPVVETLAGAYPREDDGDVARFIDGEFAYATADGWLAAGFDPAVRAVVDSRRGDADRHVETTPAVETVVDECADTTFYSATSHDRRETTDLENGTFEGQVAKGIGYALAADRPSLEAVLVFDEADSIAEDAVAEWAAETFQNVAEPEISVTDDTVAITGKTDTDPHRFTTMAFYPFMFAGGSAQSTP